LLFHNTSSPSNVRLRQAQKLVHNELRLRSKNHLVLSRSLTELLEVTIRKYRNHTIETAQVNAELIGLWLAFSGRADAVEALSGIRGLRVGELKEAATDARFHGGTEVGPCAGRQGHVGAGQHRQGCVGVVGEGEPG
jgi:hypothetical protein